MFNVRIHGRGGQGAVTAAEMLSVAAFDRAGTRRRSRPSAPSGPGRRSSSFCRMDDRPIRLREPIDRPDAVIVQDPTLLHQVDVFAGLSPAGYVLLNTRARLAELGLDDLLRPARPDRVVTVARHRARSRAPGPAVAQRCPARRRSPR